MIEVARLAYSDGYATALADIEEAELNPHIRYDVVLWMEECKQERLTANRVMLCIRNQFILQHDRDMGVKEFQVIINHGDHGGIIRL